MELNLLNVAYLGALFAVPIILYKLALPSNHGREKRIKDWYYTLKRILCKQKLEKFLNRKVKDPPLAPREPNEHWEEDLLTFHGCDLENNSIYVRFAAGETGSYQKFAEILVQLRLADGRTFTLPEGIATCALKRREWRTKVLTICPQLNGNFRIIFNGFLKETRKKNHEVDIEHFNFNFLFSRATSHLHYPKFFDKGLFADAICREQWRNGEWIHKLGDTTGQEHFGTIHGTIKSSHFGVDSIWNLVSHQSRRFGTADRYNCNKHIALFVVADDGMALHVEKRHISNGAFGSCQIKHGAVLLPNGTCFPISGCDLSVPDDHGHITNMTINIATKSRNIKTFITVDEQTGTKLSSSHWSFGYEISSVMGEASFVGAGGKSSLVLYKRKQGGGTKPPDPLVGAICSETTNTERIVVSLEAREANSLALTGGKGQSLAILAALERDLSFKVPSGFVVTTLAMEQHLQSNVTASRACIAKLKMATTTEMIQEACQRIQEYIIQTRLAKTTRDAITAELRKLRGGSGRRVEMLAVRSSGVTEDSETSSAAGQNETFLGCSTEDEIVEAVKQCWASLYSFRSVEYRRNRGIDVQTTMAVVVQQMVDSRIAGVLFTCDLDGNPSRIRITSNYGLGESIVSGEERGDMVFVKRTWDNIVSMESMEPHVKKTKIVLNQKIKSGTQKIYLNDRDAKEMSITEEEVMALAKVATQLEHIYGRHLDIEWAFEEGHLVLLQARPVTFLENWTDYELEHEFDFANVCSENAFTTANVKEVMPGALSPLCNSTIASLVDRSVAKCIRGSNADLRNRLVTMRHHIFMNYYNVLLVLPTDDIDITVQSIDISVCGHPVTTRAMLKRALRIHGRTTAWKTIKILWDSLGYYWRTVNLIEKARRLAAEPFISTDAHTLSHIIKQIDHHLELFDSVISAHSIASRSGNLFQMLSMNMLGRETDGELTPATFAQLSLFFSNGSGVISAEIPSDLEAIATEIRKSNMREEFISLSPERAASDGWLCKNIPEAGRKYQTFLTDHGHRSFREFEIMEESWGTNPTSVIKMLQTLAKLDNSTKKSEHLSIEQVVDQLDSKINKHFLKFLIGRCRNGVINREKSKSEVVRHINTIRSGFRALGERMANLQYIPSKDLVYFLTYDEIKSIINSRDPILVTKAIRRKRLYNKWNEYKFPEISFGLPKPLESKTPSIDGATTLKGTPVCPGVVTARCCCIDTLQDIGELEQGDVLITHGTDVGWTPYFPMLSGVVTELGGLISHGAVVAREYGLPCLIGVEGSLNTFSTGDQIVLDADNGCIYKIKPEQKQ